MATAHIVREAPVIKSWRVANVGGIFDVPIKAKEAISWDVDLPHEEQPWNIGLIVGPSGSGKTTIASEMFGVTPGHEWPRDQSILDGFPQMDTDAIVATLSSVGFSSPPSWLRPYHTLSNGEQFRVDLARTLAEAGPDRIAVVDEWTSVVDRTVAKVASAAAAKHVRRIGGKLLAVGCHYDVIDWLQPDWVYDMQTERFTWRSVQPRPDVELEVYRTTTDAWGIFRRHHYLSAEHSRTAACYVALIEGQPALWISVMPQPISSGKNHDGMWRQHRSVTLPDYQGIGLGNRFSAFMGSMYRCAEVAPGRPYRYRSISSHPALRAHRIKSPLWKMVSAPKIKEGKGVGIHATRSGFRPTATFEYVGPAGDPAMARALLPEQHARNVRG